MPDLDVIFLQRSEEEFPVQFQIEGVVAAKVRMAVTRTQ